MNKGIKTIIYPVKVVTETRMLFRKLLGVDPCADQPYCVGFKTGDQHIGLIPDGQNSGVTAFYHVDDIKGSLQIVYDAGAEIIQDIKKCWRERLVASAKDKDGNIIGLIEN